MFLHWSFKILNPSSSHSTKARNTPGFAWGFESFRNVPNWCCCTWLQPSQAHDEAILAEFGCNLLRHGAGLNAVKFFVCWNLPRLSHFCAFPPCAICSWGYSCQFLASILLMVRSDNCVSGCAGMRWHQTKNETEYDPNWYETTIYWTFEMFHWPLFRFIPSQKRVITNLPQAALFDCLMPRLNFGVSAEAKFVSTEDCCQFISTTAVHTGKTIL